MYKKRWLSKKIKESLNVCPVIVITGARQTGKTTFLLNEKPFKDWRYFNLDNFDTLSRAQKNPESLISAEKRIVIDEVQRVPSLLPVIKEYVDRRKDAQFVLSGSANILLMKAVSETLAGRSIYFDLLPFAYREWKEEKTPSWFFRIFDGYLPKEKEFKQPDITKIMLKGFMPRVLRIRTLKKALLWWDGYTKTYIERDLRDISKISYLSDYKRLMEILSIRTGSLINESEISNILGISQPTIHRYINTLEVSNLYIKVKPYLKNYSKRIVKAPKGYFIDPGLTFYLSGYKKNDVPKEFLGHIFENMVLLHLKILSSLVDGEVYYWRYRGGIEREVDFIFYYNRTPLPIEVKFKENIKFRDIEGLELFMEKNKDSKFGIVVYIGGKVKFMTRNILAIPWNMLC